MNQTAIFWPMIAQALLTFIIYGLLSVRRRRAVSAGARWRQFKVRTEEPPSSASAANNLMNQFEMPVLFYAICLALFVTSGTSYLTVTLAWVFVALRYVHAFVHVTSNDLRFRSGAFALGYLVMAVLWICFALHLLAAA